MTELFSYTSIDFLVKAAESENLPLSRVVLRDQAAAMEKDEAEIFARMTEYYAIMRESAEKGAQKDLRSSSGLSGGEGWLLSQYASGTGISGKPISAISGSFCLKALARSVAIAGYNASMGKIIAAPTAGSCGILPAAVLTMQEERGLSEESAVLSLWTAGGFGMVIAKQASISGAEGGCQAECGSAAAIAAAALVELAGGTPSQCASACALAIANSLGLVCDPVGGLVEVPCIARNAGGVMNAIGSADLALAGFKLPIPVDEVIETMREVGAALPASLRETAGGGLAATPTACSLCRIPKNSLA